MVFSLSVLNLCELRHHQAVVGSIVRDVLELGQNPLAVEGVRAEDVVDPRVEPASGSRLWTASEHPVILQRYKVAFSVFLCRDSNSNMLSSVVIRQKS